ncbi:MAG: creatininase family protein, partial [Haloarculaceae archaeon]
MHLADATWTDADAYDADLALLPVGSTEQHGPHAPLGTDVMTAQATAEAGADAYDGEVVVAPPIPVGIAEEHRHFAGTLWVSEDTFRDYVRETVDSLASHGWDRVVVVNGHGGNVDALREVCGRITRHDDAYAVPFTWFDAVDPADLDVDADVGSETTADADADTDADAGPSTDAVSMGHSGPLETSLLRALDGDAIREARLDDAAAGAADGWGEWQSGTNLAYDSAEFSENGAVGDPRDGTAELGARLEEA